METPMMTHSRLLVPCLLASAAAAQAPLYDLSGQTGDRFGHSVAWIGDVNADGQEDIAVGAPTGDGLQPDAGHVVILSAASGHQLLAIPGEVTGDRFGWAIAGLGDIDGDGAGDLLVGAPSHDAFTGTDCGAVYVVSGATGVKTWKTIGVGNFTQMGFAVAGPGDVDGDGTPDYAMASPWIDLSGFSDIGIVHVLSGASNTLVRSYIGQSPGDLFGKSLAAAGDVDGDGVPDLLAGAPWFDLAFPAINVGRGYVLSGAAGGAILFTHTGAEALGQLGYSAAGGFDADADGTPDAAFGQPFAAGSGMNSGRAVVLSGATQAVLHDIQGLDGDLLGYSLGGIGDVDLDGHGDLVVGAPWAEVGSFEDAGKALVYSGASGALLFEMVGYHDGEEFGISVAGAGLLNADLASDVIAGSPGFDGNAPDGGRARTVLGDAPYPTWYCTPKVNSAGCTPLITYTGCASFSAGDYFAVHAANVLPNKLGILIWSLSPNATPFAGGTLCVGPPIKRTPSQTSIVTGPGPCDARYEFLFNATYMASKGLVPGLDVYAQYWSRDNGFAPPNNAGLTGGLTFLTLP
jgi:hypothetical protein